jgi:hypothetical protein
VQVGTNRYGSVGIDGAVAFFDVANDAILIDDDVGALRPLVGFLLHVISLQDAVGGEHLVVHVAEKREINVDLLGERGIGSRTIHANAENFCIRGVDFTRGDSSLDRLKLFRSTARKGQDIDGQENVLLAAEVTELYIFPLVAEEGKIGSGVTHFQR